MYRVSGSRKFTGNIPPRRSWSWSYIEGVRIDDPEAITAMGLDPHEIGVRGFDAYLKMIFEDGFFHGDPHPGNLLVTKEGDIVFLDFGIVGILRPEKRQNFIKPPLCPGE